MSTLKLSIEFHSFWQAGTGRGDGADVDALVSTTSGGLPYFPGKTLKGILRSATELLVAAEVSVQSKPLTQEDIINWFGTPLERVKTNDEVPVSLEQARFKTEPGRLRFTSAILGATPDEAIRWEHWASNNENKRSFLFKRFASTKVDKDGMVARRSLRSIQVAVPMSLSAHIEGPDDDPRWQKAIEEALPLVRTLGAHTTRGLGRATLRRAS